MTRHQFASVLVACAISGFHVAITALTLYRAWAALRTAKLEGSARWSVLLRLACMRLAAGVTMLTGGVLIVTPALVALPRGVGVLLPLQWLWPSIWVTWPVWVISTITLDNLALRWLRARRADRQTDAPAR